MTSSSSFNRLMPPGSTASAAGGGAASAELISPAASSSSAAAAAQPARDLHFRIVMCGESGSGRTSFRLCTSQLLQTKPDVTPSLASVSMHFSSKLVRGGGGRMQLEVIDLGPAGERDMLLVRRSITSSLFVIFVNLSVVKQKVEKTLFTRTRTDTVIIHATVKDAIKKWVNLSYLANSAACPIVIVGTHKDVLSVQDEPAVAAVLQELRNTATAACDALSDPHHRSESSSATTATTTPPHCFGCYAVSCVDHSCVSENREGPKTIKALWQFLCDLSPKLADRAAPTAADASLRASLHVLKLERGLRTVLLHDLFLYSLTQGITRRAMAKALKKRRAVGDLSLANVRRGGHARVSLAVIDLAGTCRMMSALDLLRRRVATLQQQQAEAELNNNTSSGSGGAAVTSASSTNFLTSAINSVKARSSSSNLLSGGGGGDDGGSGAVSEDKAEERLHQSVEEIIRHLTAGQRREIYERGVVAWEVMSGVLGAALIPGRAITVAEKASLFWQMMTCSGAFIPCVSIAQAVDCLLDSASPASPLRQQQIDHDNQQQQQQHRQQQFEQGGRGASESAVSSSSSSSSSAFYFAFSYPDPSSRWSADPAAASTFRAIPPSVLDQVTTHADFVKGEKFHHAVRRVAFSPEFSQFTPQQLFTLFVGRLVNVANVALLCPDHLFDAGAWLRDRSLPQHSRLLVYVEAPGVIAFRFVSCADLPLRAFAAFLVNTLEAVRLVFQDFELHRVASYVAPTSSQEKSVVSPTDRFVSGPEDISRLDLMFGS